MVAIVKASSIPFIVDTTGQEYLYHHAAKSSPLAESEGNTVGVHDANLPAAK